MNATPRIFAAALCLLASASLSAQDEGLDMEDLFGDDFEQEVSASIHDPLEPINRVIFNFNDGLYRHIVKPFARTYSKIVPDPVERGIGNVFENLEFPARFVSNSLQGRFGQAGKETGKFIINTTAGIGGIFRASDKYPELNTTKEDIGQAFGRWGFGHGFYIVLPFMGPTSFRDLVGDFADGAVEPIPEPWSQIDDETDRLIVRAIGIVNDIPSLMDIYESMKRSAVDPYASVRDGYTQRRARQVED